MEEILEYPSARVEIKALCELDSRRNVAFIALEWSSIVLAAYLSQKFFNPITYFLTVFWIGSRFHALGILMHEAAHYRLFKSRRIGDIVGNVFLAWPITLTVQGYRNEHLAHHQNLNTAQDPDWDTTDRFFQFPKNMKQMVSVLVQNSVAIGFIYGIVHERETEVEDKIPLSLRLSQMAFVTTVIGSSIAFGFWKILILYWGVPLLTSLLLFDYVRAVAEHYGLSYSSDLSNSRNTTGSFLETFLIAPYNVGLHLDHHLHPGVPWYNLRKLHAVLSRDPVYKKGAHNTTDGYVVGVMNECTRVPAGFQDGEQP